MAQYSKASRKIEILKSLAFIIVLSPLENITFYLIILEITTPNYFRNNSTSLLIIITSFIGLISHYSVEIYAYL